MSALTVSKEDEKRVKGMGFLNNRGTDLFSRTGPDDKRKSNGSAASLYGRSCRKVWQR